MHFEIDTELAAWPHCLLHNAQNEVPEPAAAVSSEHLMESYYIRNSEGQAQ